MKIWVSIFEGHERETHVALYPSLERLIQAETMDLSDFLETDRDRSEFENTLKNERIVVNAEFDWSISAEEMEVIP